MTKKLLAMFRARANHRGLVTIHEETLLGELKTTAAVLTSTLDSLARTHAIRVLSPLPYLVIKFPEWSGRRSTGYSHPPKFKGSSRDLPLDVPVSSSNAAAAAASSKQEDGGAGEGEALLREVAATLEDADLEEFRELLKGFPVEIIRQALRRVQLTPAAEIRKSKVALFRYLLAKLS